MKTIFFTVADNNNLPYAKKLENSLKRWHADIPLKIYGQKEMDEIKDPYKFYRATPMFGRVLLEDYDLVIKIDADSVVTGDLNHIIEDESYDIGCVLNNNNLDPHVAIQGIPPSHYLNCGFVAMRSKKFVENWWDNCNKSFFGAYPYREQDLLNILYYQRS